MNNIDYSPVEKVLWVNQPLQNISFFLTNKKIALLTKILLFLADEDFKSALYVCKSWKLVDSITKPIKCEKFYNFYDSRSVSESEDAFSRSPYGDDLIFTFCEQ